MFSEGFACLLAFGAVAQAKTQFLGVAMAGGDFGCQIDGNCPTGSVQLPLRSLGGGDGQAQMQHFVQEGLNLFRLPTSWQFLTNNKIGSSLDASNLNKYDQLMQACLATGAHCMIDIHNFARVNGQIIGQGGPSDDQFAAFWGELAGKYATNDRVIFELMNEPHDLDIAVWAQTCQKAITAIRNAGATSQMILLPGTNFDSAATLVSSGSADLLMALTNPGGGNAGLLLDIHKYLDVDNSGTHAPCITDNVGNFTIVADYLRGKGRQGFIGETGASRDASCMTAFCAQNAFINRNADVFLGYVGWGAGSFDASYVLSLTPTRNGNALADNALMSQCVLGPWLDAANDVPAPTTPPATGGSGGAGPTGAPPGTSSGTTTITRTTMGSLTMTLTMTGSTIVSTLMTDSGAAPTPLPAGAFGGGFGGSPGVVKSNETAGVGGGARGTQTQTGFSSTQSTSGGISGMSRGSIFWGGLLLGMVLWNTIV